MHNEKSNSTENLELEMGFFLCFSVDKSHTKKLPESFNEYSFNYMQRYCERLFLLF